MAELYDPSKNYDQPEAYPPQQSAYPQEYSDAGTNPYEIYSAEAYAASDNMSAQSGLQPYVAQNYPEQTYASAVESPVPSWDDSRGLMQPQTPIHHMPPAPVFGLPPGSDGSAQEDVSGKKSSPIKGGRKAKVRKAKAREIEAASNIIETPANEAPKKAKRSTVRPFIMGMVTGMALFFAGNFVITNVLQDTSSQDFRDIERRAMQLQRPDLPPAEAKPIKQAKAP